MKLGFRVNREAAAKSAEMFIYGVIGDSWDGIDAQMILNEIKAMGDVESLDVHINSPGGLVSDGIAIHSALKRLKGKVTTYNDGLAASMASVIFQAGDRRVMAEGSLLMIHDPISWVFGNARAMRKEAEVLDTHKESLMSIYLNAGFSDGDEAKLAELLSEETWLKGEDAIAYGLADEVEGELRVAALVDQKMVARLWLKKPVDAVKPFIKNLDTPEPDAPAAELSEGGFAPRSLLERQTMLKEKLIRN